MKAIIWTKYGPPEGLHLRDIPKPSPKAKEVLIRIHATTVTMGDSEARRFDFPPMFWIPMRLFLGLFKPRIPILGQELAGEIEAVGKEVNKFKVGDRVFAATLFRFGAHAEYICLPESHPICPIPPKISFAKATTIPTGGCNGLDFVRKGKVRAGESVLINGAGGSIGTYAIQLAKMEGAEVTAVDSGEKLDMLRSIGADHVVDYQKENFVQNGQTYDVIIDIVGKRSVAGMARSLKPGGRLIIGNPRIRGILQGKWISLTSNKKAIVAIADYTREDFVFLSDLLASGRLNVVIDQEMSLAQMEEAHTYVDSGKKQGNLVILV